MSQQKITAETIAMAKSALSTGYADENLQKTTISTSTGLVYYDLAAPSKLLVPLDGLTPLSDSLPRKKRPNGYGDAAHWKAITSILGSGFDAIGYVRQGARAGNIEISVSDRLASYCFFGEESSLTFESEYASEGFEDVKALAAMTTLKKLKLKEESALLGSNKSIRLGTPAAPTVSSSGTTGTIATGTYLVSVVLLTQEGWSNYLSTGSTTIVQTKTVTGNDNKTTTINGGSSNASPASSQLVTSPATLTASATYVNGAVAYAWFVGTSGNQTLQKVTTSSTTTFTSLTTTGQPLSQITMDASYNDGTTPNNPVTAMDGLLYNAFLPNSGSYIKNLGTTLTGTGHGGIYEFDELLKTQWDKYKISPSKIWVSSQELKNVRNKIFQNGINGAFGSLNRNSNTNGSAFELIGGGSVTKYFNNFTSNPGQEVIEILLHPNLAPGTIIFYAEHLPTNYISSNTPNVAEVLTRRDYYMIDWPLVTRERQYGVYCDEVLAVYAPFCIAVITNIIDG